MERNNLPKKYYDYRLGLVLSPAIILVVGDNTKPIHHISQFMFRRNISSVEKISMLDFRSVGTSRAKLHAKKHH